MFDSHVEHSLGPYRLLEPLGHGGMGVVYRAVHAERQEIVALKTVRMASVRQLHGIRREIHALSRIRHPGIVRILDHGVDRGVPWYAMELLKGESLRDRTDEVSTAIASTRQDAIWQQSGTLETLPIDLAMDVGSWPEPRPRVRPPAANGRLDAVLSLVRRLCDPLAFLHGEGVVHRDLKPDNVLVVEGEPVLVDFGLVGRTPSRGRESLWIDGLLHGTVSYMAPKQFRGEALDARADLYALGVILYEIVTGRLPFHGATSGATATMHLSRLPLPPSERVTGVPAALDDLILKLLAKRPADRVGHADDVARRLEALGAEPPLRRLPSPRAYLYRPRLAGRAPDLERLERQLHASGAPVALVAGESGVGKTRLVIELAHSAAHAGWQVIGGPCAPVDAGTSHALAGGLYPLREALVTIADRCRDGGPEVEQLLLGDRGPILAPYAPELRDLPGTRDALEPPALPPEAARIRALTAVTSTLEALGSERPLLLVLDDLQWADDLTLQWLDQLRRSDPPALRVVGTYRLGEGSVRLRALCDAQGVDHLTLGRLEPGAVRRMISDMLAVHTPSEGLVGFLARHSEGNPFFVAEYLRASVAEGLLRRDRNGRWGIEDGRDFETLPLPTSLRMLVKRRLGGLGRPASRLLELASVIGRDVDLRLVDALAEGTDAERLDGTRELVDRLILEDEDTGRIRFVHHKLREVAYEHIAPDRRRELHARVAAALEDQLGAALHGHLGALGHHWEKGGHPDRARARYLAGAAQAARRHDLVEARALYEAALALPHTRDAEDVAARVALAGEVLRPLGALADALQQLGTALQEARHLGRLALQAAALEEQGRVTRQIGRLQDAAALLRHALAIRRGLGDALEQGRLLCALAGTLPPQQAGRCYASAVRLAEHTGDRWLAARSLLGQGRVQQRRGDPDAEDTLRRALRGYRLLGDRRGEADTLVALGDLLVRTRTAAALPAYDQALETYRAIGDRLRCAVVQANLATMLHALGRSAESHAMYGEALQGFRELGHHRFQGHALHRIGTHLRREGRLTEARALNEQALVLLEVVGDRPWSARTRRELAEIALLQGRPGEATRHAAHAVELARVAADPALHAEALTTHARALVRSGDPSAAARAAREAIEQAARAGDTRAEARTWASVARIVDGPVDPAVLERAEAILRADGRPEDAARALVARAYLARSHGDADETWLLAAREAHHGAVYLDPEVGEALRELGQLPADGPTGPLPPRQSHR